jgi:hypothetical protein
LSQNSAVFPEEMGESQGCITGDSSSPVQDLGYASGRNIELLVVLDSAVNFPPNVLIPKPFCRVGAE